MVELEIRCEEMEKIIREMSSTNYRPCGWCIYEQESDEQCDHSDEKKCKIGVMALVEYRVAERMRRQTDDSRTEA